LFIGVEISPCLLGLAGLKRAMSVALKSPHIWQPGFLITSCGVTKAMRRNGITFAITRFEQALSKPRDDWLYQGEIVVIDRA
jgi:hypothetical protein